VYLPNTMQWADMCDEDSSDECMFGPIVQKETVSKPDKEADSDLLTAALKCCPEEEDIQLVATGVLPEQAQKLCPNALNAMLWRQEYPAAYQPPHPGVYAHPAYMQTEIHAPAPQYMADEGWSNATGGINEVDVPSQWSEDWEESSGRSSATPPGSHSTSPPPPPPPPGRAGAWGKRYKKAKRHQVVSLATVRAAERARDQSGWQQKPVRSQPQIYAYEQTHTHWQSYPHCTSCEHPHPPSTWEAAQPAPSPESTKGLNSNAAPWTPPSQSQVAAPIGSPLSRAASDDA